jgi:hypothetical protein
VFEIAFSQQFQRANSLAGSIFGELFVKKSSDLCGHPISGQTLAKDPAPLQMSHYSRCDGCLFFLQVTL